MGTLSMGNFNFSFRLIKYFFLLLLFCLLCFKTNSAQTVEDRITKLMSQMTLQEKIDQLHQQGGFNTADNTRLKIPGFIMSDGPHGVRNGMATAFPVGIAMGATWDPGLTKLIGKAMGEEFWGKGISQALGPCLDIDRDPRNGRSAESGGEDQYLDAEITTAVVQGIQMNPVISTVKHFDCNSRETNRTNNNVIVSEELLMDEYGMNFRNAVQTGGAMCVMNAYTLINGEKCAESYNLLTNNLRIQWGFPYYVVSDWGSIWDAGRAINSGCNLEMGSDLYQTNLLTLVTNGTVSQAIIDDAIRKVLRTKIMAGMLDNFPQGDPSLVNNVDHQSLCLQAGKESMVLLKNQDNILPLNQDSVTTIGIIGPSADVAQIDGTGSSYVTPFYSVSPKEGIENLIGTNKVLYAKGCDISSTDTSGFAAAVNVAKNSGIVIFVGGLDQTQEGEGLDRVNNSIDLPGQQQALINALAAVNKNIIVVLYSGGICGVHSFINQIKGLIYAFYPGQEGGNALAQILFGIYNPGGKLPVTMPQTTSQLPARDDDFTNDYGCGYRWFNKLNLQPEFAFGFGLSYTTFSYSNLQITPSSAPAGQIIKVSADVTNTGSRQGDEIAELYLSFSVAGIELPVKQLRGFNRITLQPGQKATVIFQLSPNELYYFDETANSYTVAAGTYTVKVGGSSDNLPLTGTFQISSADLKPDLKIANITTVPPYPLEGDSVLFLATIINRGSGPSPAGIVHEVTFNLNGQQISKSSGFTNSIPAGGMALVCGNLGINGSNTWIAGKKGIYNIVASVNDDKTIQETTDTNNTATKSLTVYSTPPVNLALNKPVTVSSVENSGLGGQNAVDGNLNTRWSSQFSDPQYIIIDLQSVQSFNEVFLYWETAYAKEYEVQISNDGSNWNTIVHVTNGYGGTEKISVKASARYIRIYGIQRATQYSYSIYEIDIYNNSDTSLADSINNLPSEFTLSNNYPNPFNPSTTIEYEIPKAAHVKMEIFNSLGELMNILKNDFQNQGKYTVRWNGKNMKGQIVTSGIYFYKMSANGLTLVKKMLLLK
jgi:beta-glucosidase